MLLDRRVTIGYCFGMQMLPQVWMCPWSPKKGWLKWPWRTSTEACSLTTVQPTEMYLCQPFAVFLGEILLGWTGSFYTFKDIRIDHWIHLVLNSSWYSHSVVRCKALLWDSRSSSSGFSRCFVLAFVPHEPFQKYPILSSIHSLWRWGLQS